MAVAVDYLPADLLADSGTLSINSDDPDTPSPGNNQSVVVISGGTINLDQDFGYAASGTPNVIEGTVWNDSNADGMLDVAALMEVVNRRGFETLKDPDWQPQPARDVS